MAITGAQLIVNYLEHHSIKHVFGIPGMQNLELYDALDESKVRPVLVTHENCGAFMATGYAWAGGQTGVLVTVPGPGMTNSLTGLAEALLDSQPVVAFFCDVFDDAEHSFQLHDIDQEAVVKPLLKGVFRLDDFEKAPEILETAFTLARAEEPGPVGIMVSADFFMKQGEPPEFEDFIPDVIEPQPGEIEKAARLLKKAKRPCLYVGIGCWSAREELLNLAELLQMPIATTLSAKGIIPEDHPLSVGFGFGPSGNPFAEKHFNKCDVLLAVGCKFGEVATGSYGFRFPKQVIHIDINEDTLGANIEKALCIRSDAAIALRDILGELADFTRPKDQALIDRIATDRKQFDEKMEKQALSEEHVDPFKLCWTLRKYSAHDAIVTLDSGYHTFYAVSHYRVYKSRSFLAPFDYQAMGFAIPAAIGARLACQNRQTIAIVGDGCLLMSGFEMLTAIREEIPLKVIVFHDQALGIIKASQKMLYRRNNSSDLSPVNFESLAKALGYHYLCLENDGKIDEVLQDFLSHDGPVLLDAKVSYEKPPRYLTGVLKTHRKRIPFSQTKHFGLRLLKRTVVDTWKKMVKRN